VLGGRGINVARKEKNEGYAGMKENMGRIKEIMGGGGREEGFNGYGEKGGRDGCESLRIILRRNKGMRLWSREQIQYIDCLSNSLLIHYVFMFLC
jgi:hypothetical protein